MIIDKIRIPGAGFLLGFIFFVGCTKPDETIPSYIRVQKYTMKDSAGVGSISSKVSDVWVNVGNDDRGAYQIPVSIPVLKSGMQTVSLQAGVEENGIRGNRLPYPFYAPYIVNTKLVPGMLDTINPVFKYSNHTKFAWSVGDFEGTGIVLETTAQNTASAHLTTVKDSVFEGGASYEADMARGSDTFDVQSAFTFNAPMNVPVWLEINYKTTVPMDIGVIANIGVSTTPQLDFVSGVNPISHWNKVYVNLGPNLQYYYPQTAFKVYFHAQNNSGQKGRIFLDNLKLLYLE